MYYEGLEKQSQLLDVTLIDELRREFIKQTKSESYIKKIRKLFDNEDPKTIKLISLVEEELLNEKNEQIKSNRNWKNNFALFELTPKNNDNYIDYYTSYKTFICPFDYNKKCKFKNCIYYHSENNFEDRRRHPKLYFYYKEYCKNVFDFKDGLRSLKNCQNGDECSYAHTFNEAKSYLNNSHLIEKRKEIMKTPDIKGKVSTNK